MSTTAENIHNMNENEEIPEEQQEEEVPQIVDTPKKRKEVRALLNEVKNLQNERSLVNEQITAKLSELELQGVPRQAAKEALKRWQLTEAQRRARDGAYAFCLKALDIGFQADLFVDPQDEGSTT